MSLPWKKASDAELSRIEGVCLDVDDTLSTRGKLTASAYEALWRLKSAGYRVVPVTGRPAGWCDHFARFWPVDAVVGENGAFTFFMEKGVRRRLDTPGADPRAKEKLKKLEERLRGLFPSLSLASDQAYREFDLAIDIREDVPAWTEAEIDRLLRSCSEAGAHAKLSSIHVNTWYGDFDKRRGLENWLNSGAPGISDGQAPRWEKWIFIGDSPNDEPLFAAFAYTLGVANLKRYLSRMKNPPRWITQFESGEGFVEMTDRLVALRS